jgi:hypothetical protein
MRTHVYGWVVLGLAVFALPWDAREEPRQVDGRPGLAPSVAGARGMSLPAPAPVAISRAVPGPDRVEIAPARASPREPASAATQRLPRPAVDAARPYAAGPALAVREFAPGSKAHSQAIASHIASSEVQDLVSPLARLYLGYFGRVPDYEGLDYYAGERDRGEPLDAIADEFAESEEFNLRYGSLDNTAFVDRVLQNITGFPGDAEQVAYWVDQIESGRMTRGQVMLVFSESPGNRAMTANEVFVAMAYAETLGRAPGPADLSRWVRFLDAGNPRRALIDVLLADRGKG